MVTGDMGGMAGGSKAEQGLSPSGTPLAFSLRWKILEGRAVSVSPAVERTVLALLPDCPAGAHALA